MAVNMACVIADMCDADERGKRDSSGCGYLQRTLTPSDLLDWYADDMEEQRREACGELYRIEVLGVTLKEATT